MSVKVLVTGANIKLLITLLVSGPFSVGLSRIRDRCIRSKKKWPPDRLGTAFLCNNIPKKRMADATQVIFLFCYKQFMVEVDVEGSK